MKLISVTDTEATKEETKPVACESCEEEESVCELNDKFLCYDCADALLKSLNEDDDEDD